jgi:hypothetical protein
MKKWIAERLIMLALWFDAITVANASIDMVKALLDAVKKGEDDA